MASQSEAPQRQIDKHIQAFRALAECSADIWRLASAKLDAIEAGSEREREEKADRICQAVDRALDAIREELTAD